MNQIANLLILEKPITMWLGIIILIFILFTATIATLNKKSINTIPWKWHYIMARITIILTILHVVLLLVKNI